MRDREGRFDVKDSRNGRLVMRSRHRVGEFFVDLGAGPYAEIFQRTLMPSNPRLSQPTNVVRVGWSDLAWRDRDLAVARLVEAVERYESKFPTLADLDRLDEEQDARWEFEERKRRTRSQPTAGLSFDERARLMESFDAAGLTGRRLFRSIGEALAASSTVLAQHGLEWADVFNAHTFTPEMGRTQADIARANASDPFSPVPIDNTSIAIQWHRHGTGRVEVVMLVGMVAA